MLETSRGTRQDVEAAESSQRFQYSRLHQFLPVCQVPLTSGLLQIKCSHGQAGLPSSCERLGRRCQSYDAMAQADHMKRKAGRAGKALDCLKLQCLGGMPPYLYTRHLHRITEKWPDGPGGGGDCTWKVCTLLWGLCIQMAYQQGRCRGKWIRPTHCSIRFWIRWVWVANGWLVGITEKGGRGDWQMMMMMMPAFGPSLKRTIQMGHVTYEEICSLWYLRLDEGGVRGRRGLQKPSGQLSGSCNNVGL